ncbi:MAG: hypothetical protein M3P06_15095 [Acidobacteriota bacterium]|nr:hypothetical protein [Acidobacteriota bacterium]
MTTREGDNGQTLLAIAAVIVFFLVRLALLIVREPFFDELFTVWMARQPIEAILPALLQDSGPPLYYFIARIPDVMALRVMSLLIATITLALILTRKSLGDARYLGALLLAIYPPAALFAVEARAYSLCGLFVALGVIAVHERRPGASAVSFLLAAYTHWYGALFLPLVLLSGPKRRAATALAIAAVAFLPGLYLASRQPPQATAWLAGQNPIAALGAFMFVGPSAGALFTAPPLVVLVVSMTALMVAGARKWTFLPMVVVPVLLAIAFALAGRTVYFPMRFESVLAVPLVLWLATSLAAWAPRVRIALCVVLCGCGVVAIAMGALEHARRPRDPYREAAIVLRQSAKPDEKIVASGFLYLESAEQLGVARVQAFPAEQGRHPGWRVMQPPNEPLPQGEFVWIGERAAPELIALRQRRVMVLFKNDRALVLRVRLEK